MNIVAPENEDEATPRRSRGASAAQKLSKFSGNKVVALILKPFRWLIGLYKKLVTLLFNLIDGVLGLLGKIPLLGWPFKRLKDLSRILRMVANAIPIVLLLGLMLLTNTHMYPHSNSVKLPDEGSMTFTNFTKKGTEVRGLVTNTGDVVGNAGVTFDIYANKPSLNPISWFKPVKVAECSMRTVGVDIDKAKIVATHCPKNMPGVWHRVSGHLTPQD